MLDHKWSHQKKKTFPSVCKIVIVAKYEACTSEACLRKLNFKILPAVGQAHHQHPEEVSHWYHQRTSSVKNSWGCYLNHYSPAACTSSDVNVWPLRAFFNGALQGNKSRLYAGCLSASHYTVFSSDGDGHRLAAGWHHVISKFTWTFVLILVWWFWSICM